MVQALGYPFRSIIHKKGGNELSRDGMLALSSGNWKKIKVLDLCKKWGIIVINGLGILGCKNLMIGPWKNIETINLCMIFEIKGETKWEARDANT